MTSIVLVAHAPLATSLLAVARHAYADCGCNVTAVDIDAQATLEQAQAQVADTLRRLPDEDVLILTDAFGATPSNAVLNVAVGARQRIASGVNVPMLWRTLCYGHLPLDQLIERALDGGRQGIMPVSLPTAPR